VWLEHTRPLEHPRAPPVPPVYLQAQVQKVLQNALRALQDITVQEVSQVHQFYKYHALGDHILLQPVHQVILYAHGVVQGKIRKQALLHLQPV